MCNYYLSSRERNGRGKTTGDLSCRQHKLTSHRPARSCPRVSDHGPGGMVIAPRAFQSILRLHSVSHSEKTKVPLGDCFRVQHRSPVHKIPLQKHLEPSTAQWPGICYQHAPDRCLCHSSGDTCVPFQGANQMALLGQCWLQPAIFHHYCWLQVTFPRR